LGLSSFFKTENDIFYRLGKEKGFEKGREKGRGEGAEEKNNAVVKNLLLMGKLTIPEIASVTGVSETFVRKVKKSLTSN
jgi:predicted transposase YdaD